MTVLLILSVGLVGAAVAALAWAAVAPRQQVEARLRELDHYGYEASLPGPAAAPQRGPRELAESLGKLLGRRLDDESDTGLRRDIRAAGFYDLNLRALMGYQVVCAVAMVAIGLALQPVPVVPGPVGDAIVLGAFGWLAPAAYVRRRARERRAEIDRALPDAIDLIVIAVEAGQGFAQALTTAAEHTTGALREQLQLTLREQSLGLPLEQALRHLEDRVDTSLTRTFVRAVIQGEKLGVSIGQIMRDVAADVRVQRIQDAEERAQKTTVKMILPLVFLILPALVIVLMGPPVLGMGDLLGV